MTSAKKSLWKRVLIIFITVFLTYSAISAITTKLVYDGIFVRYDGDPVSVPPALADMVGSREAVSYDCAGNQLAGYLYRCRGESPRDTLIVIAPGFHAGADDYLWQIHYLLEQGWSVFAFDTTGSCDSEGESQVGFPQALVDLDATLNYIEENRRFGYRRIALLGHSRGGYAACCALGYEYDIAAVVSISGVNSAMDGVIGPATDYVGPLAYANYGYLWLYQAMLFGTDTLDRSADTEISQSDVPVLVVHGSQDQDVPMDDFSIISHRDQITSDRVEYLIFSEPGQNGHVSVLFEADGTANRELMAQIQDFLERSIP